MSMFGDFDIAPSLLSADFSKLADEIATIDGKCGYLHLDVMDGHYVPNLSIGIPVIKSIRKCSESLIYDTHLMISNPEKYIQVFADAGSDYITFHVECSENPSAVIEQIHSCGKKAGIAIHPDTDISVIFPYLSEVEMVLIMSVRPGFGGQSFMEESPSRIAAVRAELDKIGSDAILSVDGGINKKTIKSAYDAGAKLFVGGTSVFGAQDRGEAIKALAECIRA